MVENIAYVRVRSFIGRFYYKNTPNIKANDKCIVETDEGIEFGVVTHLDSIDLDKKDDTACSSNCACHGKKSEEDNKLESNDSLINTDKISEVRIKNDKNKIYSVIRIASERDVKENETNIKDAKEAFLICKEKVLHHKLDLKLINVYYFFDRTKLLFEFTSEQRVDFRELVKDLAAHFRTRIELRQIGVRDEARGIGGCGVCGRALCCNMLNANFETITIKMAKEQGMPLNTAKISGQCGRLMCCLAYEYSTYCDIKKNLPKIGTHIIVDEVDSVIRDINTISQKLFIETEDKRFMYIDASIVQNNNGKLYANIVKE